MFIACVICVGQYSDPLIRKLEDTARYAGLLLTLVEGFGRGFFCPAGQKKSFLFCFGPFKAIFGVQY